MAEFLFRDMIRKNELQDKFTIAKFATSREELGNPVHYGTVQNLKECGISTEGKYATLMTKKDYEKYDYLDWHGAEKCEKHAEDSRRRSGAKSI